MTFNLRGTFNEGRCWLIDWLFLVPLNKTKILYTKYLHSFFCIWKVLCIYRRLCTPHIAFSVNLVLLYIATHLILMAYLYTYFYLCKWEIINWVHWEITFEMEAKVGMVVWRCLGIHTFGRERKTSDLLFIGQSDHGQCSYIAPSFISEAGRCRPQMTLGVIVLEQPLKDYYLETSYSFKGEKWLYQCPYHEKTGAWEDEVICPRTESIGMEHRLIPEGLKY